MWAICHDKKIPCLESIIHTYRIRIPIEFIGPRRLTSCEEPVALIPWSFRDQSSCSTLCGCASDVHTSLFWMPFSLSWKNRSVLKNSKQSYYIPLAAGKICRKRLKLCERQDFSNLGDQWKCKYERHQNRTPDIHLMEQPHYLLCLQLLAGKGIADIQERARERRRPTPQWIQKLPISLL